MLFADAASKDPHRVAVIDGDHALTYQDLGTRVDAIATRLHHELGVRAGDVVAYQLPNWWETAALLLACSRIGAIVNPLHLVYRAQDLRYVLSRTAPAVLVVPGSFGETDYAGAAHAVAAELADPPTVCVARPISPPGPAIAFEGLHRPLEGEMPEVPTSADAGAVSLVLYTSGTTSHPKGALHSDNTLVRMVRDMVSRYALTDEDAIFVPSTMTHVSGLSFTWSALFIGATAVLLDQWDQDRGMELVLTTGSTFVGGATPFIRGLVDAARSNGLSPHEVPILRGNCGSADVPVTLIEEADQVLGAPFSRGYGLTEGIIISASRPDDTLEHRGGTDGEILPVNEVRVVDQHLRDLPDGSAGELLVRGPSNFLGYLDPKDNQGSIIEGSWIRTGDLGIRHEGYLTITGRIKDIVNRGGENIAVKEVEDLVLQHHLVSQVAIVAMPDPMMGERCCAFVVPTAPEQPPTLDDIQGLLRDEGLARQKFPERLEIRSRIPMTSTGKVKKSLLRHEIEQLVEQEAGMNEAEGEREHEPTDRES